MAAIKRNGYYLLNNGNYGPRVTTILKSAGNKGGLMNWAAKVASQGLYQSYLANGQGIINSEQVNEIAVSSLKREGERVMGFGSNVHKAIEYDLQKKDLDRNLTDNEMIALHTFKNFHNATRPEIIDLEAQVLSEKFCFGGMLDQVSNFSKEGACGVRPYLMRSSEDIEPGVTIVDYKTGNMYPESNGAQIAGYMLAYEESKPNLKIDGGLVINIPRDTPEKIKCYYYSRDTLNNILINGFWPAFNVWKHFDAPKWWHKQFIDSKLIQPKGETK